MSYCELIIRWDPLAKAHLLQTCGFSFLFFIQATFFQMKCCCCFSPRRSVSLRELQHQLFFSSYVEQKGKKRSILAREVGIIIQNNNKRISKHPETKCCSQLNKCSQNWKHKKSAEDSLANKTGSVLSVFLVISCPAWANSFSVKVCLLESIFFDSILMINSLVPCRWICLNLKTPERTKMTSKNRAWTETCFHTLASEMGLHLLVIKIKMFIFLLLPLRNIFSVLKMSRTEFTLPLMPSFSPLLFHHSCMDSSQLKLYLRTSLLRTLLHVQFDKTF